MGAEPNTENEYTRMDGTKSKGLAIHTGGIYGGFGGDGGTMKSYLPAIFKKVVDTLNASGVDYRINPGNEMARAPKKKETQEEVDKILYDWHDFLIKELKGMKVPENKIVISITKTNTQSAVTGKLKSIYPGLVEQIHGPNSDTTYMKCLKNNPKAEPDGDGFDSEAAGHTNTYGFTMPSIAQAGAIRVIMLAFGCKQYSTFNGWTEEKVPKSQDIKKARWEELRALAGKTQ
jgi:hypothetical protein